jgi:plastocyanin
MTGTFLFHCAIHGAPGGVGMAGRVIVKEFEKVYLPVVLS